MKCEKCGMPLKRAILLALMMDAGAKVSPPATECPKDGKDHSFVGPNDTKEGK